MSYMAIPFARLSKTVNVNNQNQYPSMWSILDVASNARFKPQHSDNSSGYVVDLITPDDNARVRNLKNNCSYRRIGLYPSAKNNKMIHCESFIERKLAHLLEFHPEVLSFKEQPCIIKWVDINGSNRSHIPDFQIEFRNGNIMIVEVKPDKAIDDPDISQRTEILGRAISNKYGYQYLLIVESQLDGEALLNADSIRKFHMDSIPAYEFEEIRKIFEAAKVPLCIDDIENMTCLTESKKTIANVKNLIRRGVVVFDMTKPFNQKTPLRWIERGC